MAKEYFANPGFHPTEITLARVRSPKRLFVKESGNLDIVPPKGWGVAIDGYRIVVSASASTALADLVLSPGTDPQSQDLGYIPVNSDIHLDFPDPIFIKMDIPVQVTVATATEYSTIIHGFFWQPHPGNTGLASTSGAAP